MKTSDVEELAYDRREDFPIVIASMPASTRERRFAFGVIVLLLVAFPIIMPFARVPLARVDAFIPVIQTVLCVADLITAALCLLNIRSNRCEEFWRSHADICSAGYLHLCKHLRSPEHTPRPVCSGT
jgi:hypothetical protein